MKLEIYPPTPPKPPEEQTVRLALRQEPFGAVTVVAVDHEGTPVFGGNLVVFRNNGEVYLPRSVNPKLGFHLGPHGTLDVKTP